MGLRGDQQIRRHVPERHLVTGFLLELGPLPAEVDEFGVDGVALEGGRNLGRIHARGHQRRPDDLALAGPLDAHESQSASTRLHPRPVITSLPA